MSLLEQMRMAATEVLAGLAAPERDRAQVAFDDTAIRRWIEYRPEPRPGACLANWDVDHRRAAQRLLATGLSSHAYAQASTIMALEEVLDRGEGGRQDRHRDDYWVCVFGDPQHDDRWGWRFEGHHLSVTMTVADGQIFPTPVFLGANPAVVRYHRRPVLRPLAPEEDLAFELLDALGPGLRPAAVIAGIAPGDINSGTAGRAPDRIEPLGVLASQLDRPAREVLRQLLEVYLDRLPAELAAAEANRIDLREVSFAWAGPTRPGGRHYYRVQGPDLLIEYDNTAPDGSHAHTVLRRPATDFGGDVLAAHRASSTHHGSTG